MTIPRWRQRLQPPYSLDTIILVTAIGVLSLLALVYIVFSYERLGRETMESTRRWSESVADLVASSSASALAVQDLAGIESNMQQLAALPGIDNIALLRTDGRTLVEVSRSPGGTMVAQVGGESRTVLPQDRDIPGRVMGEVFESWAVVAAPQAAELGWVRVRFSLAQRSEELARQWLESLLATGVLLLLVVVSLHVIVSRVLAPIRVLSRFAETLPERIGGRVELSSGCLEANQLAAALNHASRGIAEQVGRVQAIVATAADAIIGIDARGQVGSANPAASSMFGLPLSEMQGRPIGTLVPELRDLAAIQALFVQYSLPSGSSGRIVRRELFGSRADGTPFPVEVSLGEVRDDEGLRYACIVRDVTDERAAREISVLYERALASSHNAVFVASAKHANLPLVYVNPAFEQITGMPSYRLIGSSMELLRGVDPHDPGIHELRAAVRGQHNANVTLHKTLADGSRQVAEVSLSPVRAEGGELTHFVGILSDVTARVQAEEADAERRAQLDAVFGLSPDGFVLFDAGEKMVFANPAFERMTGIGWSEQQEALTLAEFELALAARATGDAATISVHALDSGPEASQLRLELVRPQRRVVQVQARRNTDGRRETIVYFRDVTHEDEVDRMKSEFLASAAHELRTPMVSIFGFTELLLRRKFTPERQTDMLETIHRQSGRLVKMINELLDLARIESRRGLDLQIAEYPLRDLVDHTVRGLMRKEGERQVILGDVPEVPVLVDPEKMQLALSNLLGNAFKYSPQGGNVSLDCRVEQRANGRFVMLEVRDQGIGMTPEQVARAFERFYRADASGNIPGTGLGLSLVKEVAELHKGQIRLESAAGQGTTARLWIPLPDEAEAEGLPVQDSVFA